MALNSVLYFGEEPKQKEPDIPRDWNFLEVYDSVVHNYWQHLISYYGDEHFYANSARQDAHFLVTLEEADKHYRLWAQWNMFQSEMERAMKDEARCMQNPGTIYNPSQVKEENFVNMVKALAGKKKVWSEDRKWAGLIRRMRKLDLILVTNDNVPAYCPDIINPDIDIADSKQLISEGLERIERELFLRFI